MSKKIFWIIGILAVCIIAVIVLNGKSGKSSATIDYKDQPFLGEKSAPVEIVEFGDYKCPHCGEFNKNVLPYIDQQFVQTGKAKLYFMNYAFIAPDSKTAALFAETVYQQLGNEKFWKFHELLFANQTTKDGKENLMTEDFLKTVLSKVASKDETEKVAKAFEENKAEAAFDQDMKTANKLKVQGTPAIFIGGKEFKGKTMDDFAKMVDEAANDK
ncbi:DsbA family protein [Rummeliibacillus sp. NPDC094406]|uniref:DsbA family protein n=1 Tax=Rummeliibacillus sp. NPDC094406 TaxID=3364511 RepID=UPI00381E3FE0